MIRNAKIKQTLFMVLVLNWAVALAKIIFGFWIKSASMAADGFHSFSDGCSNIIGLAGIRSAAQPVDKQHPYGHKKYETFYSLIIAILLFIVCFNTIHVGLERIKKPLSLSVNTPGFVVMLITIAVNIMVVSYEYRLGRRLYSDILVSDAGHTRADILTSFSVIIALFAAKIGYPIVDAVTSLIIAGFIGYTGFDILRRGSGVLCDAAVIDPLEIERLVKNIEGVKTCHKIRTRGRRDDIFIDLHVLVKDDMHMDRAHDLSCRIEEAIKKHFPGASDVVVHLEPIASLKHG